jgi:hypothetical protein
MRSRGFCLALLLSAWCTSAVAYQDSDVDLIPATRPAAAGTVAQPGWGVSPGHKIYLENAATGVWDSHGLAVPLPPPRDYLWQERLLLDVRTTDLIGKRAEIHLSTRLNFRDEDDVRFPSHENVVNDLREAYGSWHPSDQTYVDVGRINIKSGIALGYNPTDFFKTRSVTEPLSLDPSSLREDRLGTLLARVQHIWGAGSLTIAFAPGIRARSRIYTNTNLPSFNPMFDRTNADERFLVKGSINLGDNASPEFLLYREGGQLHLGTNLSVGLGQSTVAYLEWSGARRPNLITEAFNYGRETGTLPVNPENPLSAGSRRTFRSELALGASYTTKADLTVNFEYLLNQAGFSRRDWDAWFAAGAHAEPRSPLIDELWYFRAYARDQQQQNTEQAYFARADWVNAFNAQLELTGFALVDAYDQSGIAQVSANYYLSDSWTIGGLGVRYFGSRRSDFGSLGTSFSLLCSVVHYF